MSLRDDAIGVALSVAGYGWRREPGFSSGRFYNGSGWALGYLYQRTEGVGWMIYYHGIYDSRKGPAKQRGPYPNRKAATKVVERLAAEEAGLI